MGSWRRHLLLECQRGLLGDIPGFLFTGRYSLKPLKLSTTVVFDLIFLPDASHLRIRGYRGVASFDFQPIPPFQLRKLVSRRRVFHALERIGAYLIAFESQRP